ncbi:hypothetical protein [Nonomuraea sp. NPDC049141]|uniref:hypothetical protein n=1 Tax=Nonomuraea sp. NPDC049141 TaxID=3155500 RepID=UPI0033D51842
MSPTLIAQRLDHNSAQAVSADIAAALKRAAKAEGLAAEHLLHQEIGCLDRMMAALWTSSGRRPANMATDALRGVNFGLASTTPEDHRELSDVLTRLRLAGGNSDAPVESATFAIHILSTCRNRRYT